MLVNLVLFLYLAAMHHSIRFWAYPSFILWAFLSPWAHAKETARVLPATIFRARVVGVATGEVKDSFNAEGKLQGLGYGLNRTATIEDLAAGADPQTRAKLGTLRHALNSFQSGLGDQIASSDLYSDVSVRQRVYLGALEYGLTPRLSLGIRAPVVHRSFRNRFRVSTVNNAGAIHQALGALSPEASAGLLSLSGQELDTEFFEQALFASKGYVVPRDFERTQLGDVEMGGKYNFFQNDLWTSSVLVGVSLPTGAKRDLKNPFDGGISKEAFCYAVQLLQDLQLSRGFVLGGAAKLGYSLEDQRERAVPLNANDSLPSLLPAAGQVQDVTRQRGAQLETEFSAAYRFPGDKFGLWSAYQYSRKGRDRFSGSGNLYYEGLAKNTNWNLHATEIGAEFSTIPAFRKGTFSLPMELSLLYNRPLRGINTPMAPYARLDLMLYF